MTERHRQIAEYVAGHRVLGRYVRPISAEELNFWSSDPYPQLPGVEGLCEELLEDAEFRALQLGGILGTTEGQMIAEAVSMVIPPGYTAAFNLAVDGLTLAAQRQAEAGRRTAGGVALLVIVAAVVIAVLGRETT
jgi:hypothetical protein